jgi:hypothetical protein
MAEVAEAGGILDAAYYVDRWPGETYNQWKLRKRTEKQIEAIEASLIRMGRQLAQLRNLVEEYGADAAREQRTKGTG